MLQLIFEEAEETKNLMDQSLREFANVFISVVLNKDDNNNYNSNQYMLIS